MRVELLFPSKYLRAADLKERDVTLTVVTVKVDELQMKGGKKEKKPVVYFRKTEKMLVLNKTNAMAIAARLGYDTDAWIGKAVTLFPTKDRFGPDIVDCIRVRNGATSRDADQGEPDREPGEEG